MSSVRVIDLSKAPGAREAWSRPVFVILLWILAEALIVTNPLQLSSKLRVVTLKAFGAQIGESVIIRPRVRVKFPWNLKIGSRSWIGEGVWIHNQDLVNIGNDVVISQETMITNGSHRHRQDMALITKPIEIMDGVWVTSRCMVLGGSQIGVSSLIQPMSVVASQKIASGEIWGGNPAEHKGMRFEK